MPNVGLDRSNARRFATAIQRATQVG